MCKNSKELKESFNGKSAKEKLRSFLEYLENANDEQIDEIRKDYKIFSDDYDSY